MATGKSGFITTSAKTPVGGTFDLRLGWSEVYDIDTNKSVVSITSFEAKYTYGGNWYPTGSITVDGKEVVSMVGSGASHIIAPTYGGEKWAEIKSGATGGALPPWASKDIEHNTDGSKSITIGISISFWRSTEDRFTLNEVHTIELATIPRASEITSAGAVTLGNKCSIKWTPKAEKYQYKLRFSIGNWSHTTDAIHPNKTTEYTYSGYTIPLEVAEQIPDAATGTMNVDLYTYSDSDATVQIGDTKSATFTVTVPDNDATQPAVTMELTSVSSLPDAFAGLYIQGKTKVKAELSAVGKYGATIKSYSMKAEGVTYDDYLSEHLANAGIISVYGYAKDSRGITGSVSQDITVIPYSNPRIVAVSGEGEVVAARCDENGDLRDDGTYLKIKAKRIYSHVEADGVQKNFCQIRFRYKLESAPSYSDWITIMAGDSLDSDEIVSGALLGGVLSNRSSYLVQVQAIDDIGESAITSVPVMTTVVYMHRTKNAMGLGKYAEGENILDVAWDTHLHGEVRIGQSGITLKEYILAVISGGG